MSDFGFVNLRGDSSDKRFLSSVSAALEQAIPASVNTLTTGHYRVYCLGPDEWLIVVPQETSDDVAARLKTVTAKVHAAVTDVSGGNRLLSVNGEGARTILEKGCPLDLHPSVFAVGHCAQSVLAKAAVLIGHVNEDSHYEIIVRRTFSDYLRQWLRAAGQPC